MRDILNMPGYVCMTVLETRSQMEYTVTTFIAAMLQQVKVCRWKLSENIELLIVNKYDKSKYSSCSGRHGGRGWGWGGGLFTALIKFVIGMCCAQEVALFPKVY